MAPKLHIISLFSLCTAMLQEKQLIIFAGHSCKYMHCICFQNIIFWKHLFEDSKNERKRKSLWGSRAGQHVSYAVVTSWENTFQVKWSLFEQKCLCGKMWTWIELKPDLMYSSWRCVKKEKTSAILNLLLLFCLLQCCQPGLQTDFSSCASLWLAVSVVSSLGLVNVCHISLLM